MARKVKVMTEEDCAEVLDFLRESLVEVDEVAEHRLNMRDLLKLLAASIAVSGVIQILLVLPFAVK